MKAVVTGASGFAGRYLTAALKEAGWSVTGIDRQGRTGLHGDLAVMPLRTLRCDVLFHLAAFSNPSASVGLEGAVFDANVAVTARLLREVPAGRFVIASSCAVYGSENSRAREGDPTKPETPYAASKLCAEALALASGRDVVLLRPFNHTGPGQSEAYVCPRIARQIARAEAGLGPVNLVISNLSPRRDFFDVRDMARAYLAAAERGRRGEIYNVATGTPVSIGRICGLLAGHSRIKLKIKGIHGPSATLSGDAEKFQRHTGWKPRLSLDRTLQDLLASERSLLV